MGLCFYRSGALPRPRASFFSTILYHICRRLSTSATKFFLNFLLESCIFFPPAQGGARKRTDARPKAAQAAPMDGEGPAGRTERWEGRGPAGPDARAADKTARATSKQGGGRAAAPPGRGAGGANPHKTRARTLRRCRCFYSIKRARARRTKASHETRAQTGTNGKTRDAAGPGTIGNRAAPANPPRGGPAWEVGPQTERRLRSADARVPEHHNTRPWGGGPLPSGRGPTDPPLSRSRQRHPRARHQLTGGAGPPLVQAPPFSPLKIAKNLRFWAVFLLIFCNFLQRFTKILHSGLLV